MGAPLLLHGGRPGEGAPRRPGVQWVEVVVEVVEDLVAEVVV